MAETPDDDSKKSRVQRTFLLVKLEKKAPAKNVKAKPKKVRKSLREHH
jgi:hypothetical protein